MLIPTHIINQIYENLFESGVMTAKKDVRPNTVHQEVKVKNLYVIKALQSLKSRNFVREQFAWRSYYWFLNNEGITYLREYLHLPAEIVPATMKASRSDAPARPTVGGSPRPAMTGAYRTGNTANMSEAVMKDAPGDSVQFKGGMGRGNRM